MSESCVNGLAVGCSLCPLLPAAGATCDRCNTTLSAQQLRDGAAAQPALQRHSRLWDFAAGDALRSAPGWTNNPAVPTVVKDAHRLVGYPYRMTSLTPGETDAARRREFDRVSEQFYRFMGVENVQRFQLTRVDVIDNAEVERRFSECYHEMLESALRGPTGGADALQQLATEVQKGAPCDDETQVVRGELRRRVVKVPWRERCLLMMLMDECDQWDRVLNDACRVLHKDEVIVERQLKYVLKVLRFEWCQRILETFERYV